MKKILCTTAALFFLAGSAYAVPFLQLDIEGGEYDTLTESIAAVSEDFTLYALINSSHPHWDATNTSYYISIAVEPLVETPSYTGTFDFEGTTYNVPTDMTWGTPPVGVWAASQDMPSHGIYPTYFIEYEFDLSGALRADLYDSQTDVGGTAGGLNWNPSGPLYVVDFAVDTALLSSDVRLHFDLYNKNPDGSLAYVNPFSHDAQSIPEPTTMLLFGTGLAGLAGIVRRKRK